MPLETENIFERSPATEALQGNLDNTLTLNRKRSGWFGVTRHAVARGALQAKSYVGSLRGDSPAKADEEENTEPCRRADRQQSFSPKKAFISLRQHVQSQGPRSRQRRGTLMDVHGFDLESNEEGVDGSEKLDDRAMPVEHVDGPDTAGGLHGHSKRASIDGGTFIGSIRRMAAKHTGNSPPKVQSFQMSDQLPSTPIQPAPALTLDLEAGFAPDLVLSAAEKDDFMAEAKPVTPIRCTPLEMNLDGANEEDPLEKMAATPDTVDDSVEDGLSELFERGVTVERSLKRMVSLDAMAEKCTQSPAAVPLPESRMRHRRSETTIFSSPPSDMEEIKRQPSRVENSSGSVDDVSDPFVMLRPTPMIEIHGPDSELAYRPETPPQAAEDVEEEAMEDLSSLDGHLFKSGISSVIIPSSPEQRAMSTSEEHRSMVTEVLDIARSDGRESKDAISENYDLQVAMGFNELGIGELRTSTGRAYAYELLNDEISGSDLASPRSQDSERLWPESANTNHEESLDEALDMYKTYSKSQDGLHQAYVKAQEELHEAFVKAEIGFDEVLTRRQSELMNDLLKAVEGPGEAEGNMAIPSSPESTHSASSMKRKPLPKRYRSRGGRPA